MKNYLFEVTGEWSELCGECFFVQCNNRKEANEALDTYFWGEEVKCLGIFTDEEAECMGYDTY